VYLNRITDYKILYNLSQKENFKKQVELIPFCSDFSK